MDWLSLTFALAIVVLGAEALVRGASLIAVRLGISPLFIGLTVVGFGTSSPELVASVVAVMRGAAEVSVGNAVGSNIFNIGVIVGITAVVHPIRARLRAVRRDLVVALVAGAAPWVGLAFGAVIPRAIGGLFVGLLAAYLVVAYRADRRASAEEVRLAGRELSDTVSPSGRLPGWSESVWFNVLLVVGGLAMLISGSRVFISSALELARAAGISEMVIGLTIVSAGTSLPELVTSVVAGARRNPDIAVGNIIGSAIFNVFGILGISALIRPLPLPVETLAVDLPVMLLALAALAPILRTGGVVSRREGLLLLLGYGVYLATLVWRGA